MTWTHESGLEKVLQNVYNPKMKNYSIENIS